MYHLIYFDFRFLGDCKSEGCGWVVKPPFVTNRFHLKKFKDEDNLLTHLTEFFEDDCGVFPYTMIQPCMENTKEYRVIYIPSKSIQYIVSSTVGSKGYKEKAFSSPPHEELFAFVKRAFEIFNNNCFYAITDGLFRIDVFQNKNGDFVVNELESLLADYGGSRETEVTAYLFEYWLKKLEAIPQIISLIKQSIN
jgi:hypothetical protein